MGKGSVFFYVSSVITEKLINDNIPKEDPPPLTEEDIT